MIPVRPVNFEDSRAPIKKCGSAASKKPRCGQHPLFQALERDLGSAPRNLLASRESHLFACTRFLKNCGFRATIATNPSRFWCMKSCFCQSGDPDRHAFSGARTHRHAHRHEFGYTDTQTDLHFRRTDTNLLARRPISEATDAQYGHTSRFWGPELAHF